MNLFRPQLPSTSAASASAPIDQPKFEHRHEKYAAKLLFAERKFNELKTGKFYQARKAQIEKRREAIKKRICPHFLRLKMALDEEYNEKKKRLDTVRSLRLCAAERCREAELSAARLNLHEMETTSVRQQCEGALEQKMGQLKAETEAVEVILRNLVQSENSKSQKDVPNERKVLRNKYFVESETQSSNCSANGMRITPKSQWRNVPAMIAQLPTHCIDNDLTKIFSDREQA